MKKILYEAEKKSFLPARLISDALSDINIVDYAIDTAGFMPVRIKRLTVTVREPGDEVEEDGS